jgi:IS5 family transposase
MPNESITLYFRCLRLNYKLTDQILAAVNVLIDSGLLLKIDTVVNAEVIVAPSSTKSNDQARDSEVHSSQKCNQCHFDMKLHIDVEADSGLMHNVRGI